MASRGLSRFLLNSLRRLFGKPVTGKEQFIVGRDDAGNIYYEKYLEPGRRRVRKRWVEPADGDQWSVPNTPTEWLTWLQERREEPPSVKEITGNLVAKQRTLQRAEEINNQYETKEKSELEPPDTGKRPFPTYDDLEIHPGEFEKQKSLKK